MGILFVLLNYLLHKSLLFDFWLILTFVSIAGNRHRYPRLFVAQFVGEIRRFIMHQSSCELLQENASPINCTAKDPCAVQPVASLMRIEINLKRVLCSSLQFSDLLLLPFKFHFRQANGFYLFPQLSCLLRLVVSL
jgi:hypothetical protein